MKNWKKITTIFICLSLLVGGSLSYLFMNPKTPNVSEWQAYSPGDQRFDVQFPKEPVESSEKMDIADKELEYNELKAEEEKATYSVSYVDFPGHWKWIGTQKLLTKSFDMFLENEQNVEKILEKEIIHHNGNTALSYHLKQDGKEVKGRFIIVGNTLYRMTVTYPSSVAEKIDPKSFLDSFRTK